MDLGELEELWRNCSRCGLCETRRKVVFGEGNPNADILIVGEAPGEIEDRQGRPFVGESGRILQEFMDEVHISREVDCYITNVVGCRPTAEAPDEDGKIRVENRQPSKVEREACRERLLEIIYCVDPLLIIAAGKVPASALLGRIRSMNDMEGQVYTMKMMGRHREIRYPVMVIRHPANLSRTVPKQEGEWVNTLRAMFQACEIVDYLRQCHRDVPIPDRRGTPPREEENFDAL